MKTEFQLLWIDNNKDFVASLRPRLEKWMDGHGFGLIITYQKDAAGAIDLLRKTDIAFVVLDYHLGKKDGDVIIAELRKAEIYQDIIFYSQDLDRSEFEAVDGVFFVDRRDAETRIKNLLELKIRPSMDLATFRGWMLADSIELEIMLGGLLAKCFGDQKIKFEKRVLEHESLFDFYKKWMVLSGILKDRLAETAQTERKTLSDCKKLLDQFPDDIIHPRNALAHQRAETQEGRLKVRTKGKGTNNHILVSAENFISIRRKIRQHRDNLIALDNLIN